MDLEKISNLELLELYKEEKNFTEFLEKLQEQTLKELDDKNE